MQPDIYEPIWSKLGTMIDTTKLYILILVEGAMVLIQGHKGARKQRLCANCLTKFSTDLDGIGYVVETSCSDELRKVIS